MDYIDYCTSKYSFDSRMNLPFFSYGDVTHFLPSMKSSYFSIDVLQEITNILCSFVTQYKIVLSH